MAYLPYPRWRKWLSYLMDQTLEFGEGDHGDELAVLLRKGKLLLQSNGAIYSWEDNYYNFRRAFERLDWEALPGDRVLLLGLGLGSVPQMTEELFGKRLDYTAVEYDEAVVALAEDYLLYRLHSNITTVIADAAVYVAQTRERFDLVLVDIFVDDKIPEVFNTAGFAERLKTLLVPGGCVISNRLTFRAADKSIAEVYYRDVWKTVFENAAMLDVSSNWMLFSDERFLLAEKEGKRS